LPNYFPAFLRSCEANPSVNWLFLTDQPPPQRKIAPCISWVRISREEINQKASDLFRVKVDKSIYGMIDLRPAFGALLADHLQGFDYWGHCDCDVIYSNIRSHIDPYITRDPDVISARDDFLCGHFTLWKNVERVNNFFRTVPGYLEILQDPIYRAFDEGDISSAARRASQEGTLDVQHASSLVVDWPQLERIPLGWSWEDGELRNLLIDRNPMYIHFMTWKRWMKHVDFGLEACPDRFSITRRGIWHAGLPFSERLRNHLGYETLFRHALPVYRKLHMQLTGKDKALKNRK
jgi:hypothetical protein